MSGKSLEPALVQPSGFRFGEVSSFTTFRDLVPHVSVATFVPASPLSIPASAWT